MPEGIRSATGELATRIPGVTFGGSFPRLAALADRVHDRPLVRARRRQPRHQAHRRPRHLRGQPRLRLLAGRRRQPPADRPAHQRRCSSPAPSTPRRGRSRPAFGRFDATGPLSSADAPYDPEPGGRLRRRPAAGHPARPPGRPPRACSPRWTALRIAGSDAAALEGVDADARAGLPPAHGRARRGLRPGREDPRLVARYDTAPLVRPEAISKKWNNHNNYVDNAKSLGKLLLLARRLCERGCGFVTVTTNFVWDMHADVNNATMERGHGLHGPAAGLRRCRPSSKTSTPAGSTRRSCSSPAARWAARRGSTPRGAATTGATSARCCWPAAGCRWAGSSANPTATARRPVGAGHGPPPDRHDPAHPVRRRPVAARARPAPRVLPDDGGLGADPRPRDLKPSRSRVSSLSGPYVTCSAVPGRAAWRGGRGPTRSRTALQRTRKHHPGDPGGNPIQEPQSLGGSRQPGPPEEHCLPPGEAPEDAVSPGSPAPSGAVGRIQGRLRTVTTSPGWRSATTSRDPVTNQSRPDPPERRSRARSSRTVRSIEEVIPVQAVRPAGPRGQVGDAGRVRAAGGPLGEDGEQGREVRVEDGRRADQEVISGSSIEAIPAGAADEHIVAPSSDQDPAPLGRAGCSRRHPRSGRRRGRSP